MAEFEPMCPFLRQDCIQEKCRLYNRLPVVVPGPLIGGAKKGAVEGCALNVIAYLLNNRLPFPVPMPPDQQGGPYGSPS